MSGASASCEFLCREVTQMMEQMNFSINFILYVICSKGFRKHLLKVQKHSELFLEMPKQPEIIFLLNLHGFGWFGLVCTSPDLNSHS